MQGEPAGYGWRTRAFLRLACAATPLAQAEAHRQAGPKRRAPRTMDPLPFVMHRLMSRPGSVNHASNGNRGFQRGVPERVAARANPCACRVQFTAFDVHPRSC